jgi:hypothetical protein
MERKDPDYATRVSMEMRKEIRYQLDSQVLFLWASVDHKRLQGDGMTRDLSVFGAFIHTATCPPVQTAIQLEIILPSLTGTRTEIRIKGMARVVRVEHSLAGLGQNGFAVVRDAQDDWNLSASTGESDASRAAELIEAGAAAREQHPYSSSQTRGSISAAR